MSATDHTREVSTPDELDALPTDVILVDSQKRRWAMHTEFSQPNQRAIHREALVARLPLVVERHPDDRKVWVRAMDYEAGVAALAQLGAIAALAQELEKGHRWNRGDDHVCGQDRSGTVEYTCRAVLDLRTILSASAGAIAKHEQDVRAEACAWCPSPATGTAEHSDGRRWPSCGELRHGYQVTYRADALAEEADRG